MTHKLLPFALSALALAGPAFAAEETSPVNLYGILHVSVDALDNGDDADLAVSSNSSRIGVKGDKALSDTSKLLYLAEWQIRANGEGENLSRRNQWLGLKQSYGEWRVGRIDTPLKNLRGKVDVFYSDQLGENRTVTAQTGFDERFDNVIQFEFGSKELRATLFYSTDSNLAPLGGGSAAADDNDYDVKSITGLYDVDNWYVGVGYETRAAQDKVAPITSIADPSAIRAVGGFKFGDGAHKLGFYYEQASDINGTAGADRDTAGASYSWKLGDNTFKAGYYLAGDLGSANDTGGGALSLGLDHAYGKNTIAYVTVVTASSDDNTNLYTAAPGRTGHDGTLEAGEVALGATTSGVSVGIRHQF